MNVVATDAAHTRDGMRRIPGACFRMGSDNFYPEEKPAHRVRTSDFVVSRARTGKRNPAPVHSEASRTTGGLPQDGLPADQRYAAAHMSAPTEPNNQTGERKTAPETRLFDANVLRDYSAAELARAIAHLGWRGGRMHEGIHQARKSLRRVRAVLALGAGLLGPGAELIDREVRRVNRRMSKMRDAQALVETLDRLLNRAKSQDELPVLRRARRVAAQARADSARRERAEDPDLAQKRMLLTTLHAALPALPWSSLTETRVRDELDAGLARIETAGARARANGGDKDWHRWRRRARRLSQQHRALGDEITDLGFARKRCKALAELLGEAQDHALLRQHCGRRSIFAEPDRHVLAGLTDEGTQRMRERIEKSLAPPAVVSSNLARNDRPDHGVG